jgi:hypothetical protein
VVEPNRADIDGVELEYEICGAGEPVVLVHWGIGAAWAGPFGPNYRAALDQRLPGACEQAVVDADAFFTQELPALQQWSFTREDARRIKQPALVVLGELQLFPRDGSCCLAGCRTPSRSTSPTQLTCFTSRIRSAWRRA